MVHSSLIKDSAEVSILSYSFLLIFTVLSHLLALGRVVVMDLPIRFAFIFFCSKIVCYFHT